MDLRLALTVAAARARRAVALLCLAVGALAAPPALAADTPADAGAALASGLEQQVRQLALDAGRSGVPGAPRVEVSVGQLDARLRLAPCAQVQAYVPDGVRLWGKSRVGLRCVQGPTKWNVYLPITVKVFGTALVVTRGAASGSVLSAADLSLAEVDLAEDASPPVARAELAVGRTVAHTLKVGQSLRQSHLKARQWFAAGETVTVLAQGDGFSVASEAQALNPGIEGQPVRVRTESGRVLTGQPTGERRVELAL
ncbi:MAG TPA: flagellar basal body P-ring formation chaperone FlgA [Burkholderiaceae bacterium]|nr:flagellar basal body P-ring formation chaperone FlgA [Burkholderiaceae bacterium]